MFTPTRRPVARRHRLLAIPIAAATLAASAGAAIAAPAATEPMTPSSGGAASDPGPAAATSNESKQDAVAAEEPRRTRMRLTDTSPHRTFLDSGKKARFEFELAGTEKRDLIVKAIRVADGEVKRRWRLDGVEPKESQRITWNGKTSKGSYTSQGKHTFKVFERGGGKTDMRKAEGKKRFRFYKHRFPLAARHDFGDGFGAGRGHQGIDIFANCGKKVRAARGGRVQVRASHSSAGKYLVIDGHGTGQDYVYMHMRGAGRPAEGSRVRTGDVIGRNSDTGNASGCHVHFEIWSSPGWYEGGRAIRPDKRVRRWDAWS